MYTAPQIVINGLVLYLDAGNTKSYPTTGTTWYDISTNKLNSTLTNVGFDTTKQCMLFSTSGQSTCVVGNSNPILNFNNGSFSIEVVFKITSPAIGTVNSLYIKRQVTPGVSAFKGYTYRVLGNGPASYTIVSVDNGTGVAQDNTFLTQLLPYYTLIDSVIVFDVSTLKLTEYRNGVFYSNTNTGAMTGSSYSNSYNLTLGKFDGNSLDAEYYILRAYNRTLSATEVLQNFNATKTRYGL